MILLKMPIAIAAELLATDDNCHGCRMTFIGRL